MKKQNGKTTGNVYLKTLRKKLGLSQTEFAQIMNVTVATICMWEKGKRLPSPQKAKMIMEFAKTKGYRLTFDQIYS